MKRFLFYPGCSFAGAGGYAKSLAEVSNVLDFELKELEDWNCCGATMFKAVDKAKAAALAARNYSLCVEQGGGELVVPCNACLSTLRSELDLLREDAELRKAVGKALGAAGHKLEMDIKIRHILDVLIEDISIETIKSKVKRPLSGFLLSPYYGCQYARPARDGIDPDNPKNLDLLIEALGAETPRFSAKILCCGASQTVGHLGMSKPLIADILAAGQRNHSHALLTICPLCNLNLESYQDSPEIRSKIGNKPVPVSFFSQAMGFAFGLDREKLALNKLIAPPSFTIESAVPKTASSAEV